MLREELKEKLSGAFAQVTGARPDKIVPLPPSGSDRSYFRLSGGGHTCIGAHHTNAPEREAFIYLTRHFRKKGLQVPDLLYAGSNDSIYLVEDLGGESMFDRITELMKAGRKGDVVSLYKKVLDHLLGFQFTGHEGLDYSICYPRPSFDRQSILWDLNYFKYNYLKPAGIAFHEDPLENDFETLVTRLLDARQEHFMYRDFQSRNILLRGDEPWFIDYQGGRKGPLQYDVASLLFQVRAGLPFDLREELLNHYIGETEKNLSLDKSDFVQTYYAFVLLRLLQVLGAYGFRGLYEKKPHFLQSLALTGPNIEWILGRTKATDGLPEIRKTLERSLRLHAAIEPDNLSSPSGLTVAIYSFSYKKGLPEDLSGNGGGHVFDCRSLPNPGREEQYRAFTGKDDIIIDYLQQFTEVEDFARHSGEIVLQSVNNYRKRGFSHLMVSFGCTGGQHRSVYFAERIAELLKGIDGVSIRLRHKELENNEQKDLQG